MYRVKVFAGFDECGYLLRPWSDKPWQFDTYEAAHRAAEKAREGSSLGIWFRIEEVTANREG